MRIKLLFIIVGLLILSACYQDTSQPQPTRPPNDDNIKTPIEEHTNRESEEDSKETDDPNNQTELDESTTEEKKEPEIVLQNKAFRIYEPTPHSEVKEMIIIRGLARVFEGTIIYEFEDGHFILDEGVTTATKSAPDWGEFEITITLDEVANYSGRIFLFEEDEKDGSRINELIIPVHVIN